MSRFSFLFCFIYICCPCWINSVFCVFIHILVLFYISFICVVVLFLIRLFYEDSNKAHGGLLKKCFLLISQPHWCHVDQLLKYKQDSASLYYAGQLTRMQNPVFIPTTLMPHWPAVEIQTGFCILVLCCTTYDLSAFVRGDNMSIISLYWHPYFTSGMEQCL